MGMMSQVPREGGHGPVGGPGALPGASLTDEDFERIRDLIHGASGIHLTREKRSLVASRLQRRLLDKGGITFGEYYRQVIGDETGEELSDLINRVSTNHTFFNREKDHFDFFRSTALPEAAERARKDGSRDVRVWCAASSTGEEPYMLAMLMREAFGPADRDWQLGLLATDISEKALAAARAGVYSAEQAGQIPADLRRRYFVARPDGRFEAGPLLKEDVTFRRFNLVKEAYPFRKPFDVVFCRNVMIYFDHPTKQAVVRNIARCLRPGGYLVVGLSESFGRQAGDLRCVRPAVYRKDA